jgi:hypothetical protein
MRYTISFLCVCTSLSAFAQKGLHERTYKIHPQIVGNVTDAYLDFDDNAAKNPQAQPSWTWASTAQPPGPAAPAGTVKTFNFNNALAAAGYTPGTNVTFRWYGGNRGTEPMAGTWYGRTGAFGTPPVRRGAIKLDNLNWLGQAYDGRNIIPIINGNAQNWGANPMLINWAWYDPNAMMSLEVATSVPIDNFARTYGNDENGPLEGSFAMDPIPAAPDSGFEYAIQAWIGTGEYWDDGEPETTDEIFFQATTALIAPHRGDANVDGDINFDDLSVLSQNYNNGPAYGTAVRTWEQGDFTDDGNVDFNDLVWVSQRYNTSYGFGEPAPASSGFSVEEVAALAGIQVPEPASAALLLMLLPLSRRLRR